MFLTSLFRKTSRNAARARPSFVPRLESLEDRFCPSGGYLIVGSFDNNSVLRYSETTGAFVDQFDPQVVSQFGLCSLEKTLLGDQTETLPTGKAENVGRSQGCAGTSARRT